MVITCIMIVIFMLLKESFSTCESITNEGFWNNFFAKINLDTDSGVANCAVLQTTVIQHILRHFKRVSVIRLCIN